MTIVSEPHEDFHQKKKLEFEALFENYGCPFDAWDSNTSKALLHLEYTNWLLEVADWSTLLTLTFRDPIAIDPALGKFNRLIQVLNRDLFGERYPRIVKHSYFSYVLCAEYQERDVLHFHVLIDRPFDYSLTHSLWNDWAGFAHTRKIVNSYSAIRYITKYATKEGDIRVYRAKKLYVPKQYPIWWKNSPVEII